MPDNTKVLIRNAREQDISAVAEIDAEAFTVTGTTETPETFQLRLTAFPHGFIILVAGNEIAAYGCSEKWLTERVPTLNENALSSHQPDGRIFCITAMAVKEKYRGRGYGLRVLDKLLEIAHLEGCQKIMVEAAQAQGFYLKRGFHTIQNHVEGGTALEVMSLDLKPNSMTS